MWAIPLPNQQLAGMMRQYVGEEATSFALSVMAASRRHVTGGTATIIGVGAAVLGATVVFMELKSALNTIWEVKHEDGSSILRLIYARVISFFLVVGAGLLLVVSLVLSAVLSAIDQFVSQFIASYPNLLKTPNLLISFGILPVLLAMIYRLLPDTKIWWRDVWLGAAAAGLLFAVREIRVRLVSRHNEPAFRIRRGRFIRNHTGVGLLLVSGGAPGSRAHEGLCGVLWITLGSFQFGFGGPPDSGV